MILNAHQKHKLAGSEKSLQGKVVRFVQDKNGKVEITIGTNGD
jgi:hypothetical protein